MKPKLEPLHGGWAAVGEGWTAYGSTKGEALLAFRLASRIRARQNGRRNRDRLIARWRNGQPARSARNCPQPATMSTPLE